MAVVKLNNDLKELYGKEQEEIQVILARLSADAAEYVSEIRTDYATLYFCKRCTGTGYERQPPSL